MYFLCVCCLIGVIIYACCNNTLHNGYRNNIGGLANAPMIKQLDNLQGTANYSQEFGPVIYYANDNHNKYDREYRFKYRYVGGGWRAYILRTPSFNNRTKGAHVHMLSDSGAYYICWDRSVSTIHDMQIISKRWADNFQEYLSTGRTF